MDESNLLTVVESAKYLRLKPSTIRAWLLRRRVAFIKMGGRVLLRRSDLDKLIASSIVPARVEAGQSAA
jgi:excisionase family DNA binding protein